VGDGLVRRETDPDDRRAVRVALTADGRRQLQRFEHAAAAALAESLAPLTSAQRQRIRAAFADLRTVIPTQETSQKETANVR
jgi:DNA-binding MarR family transcriptional regulator